MSFFPDVGADIYVKTNSGWSSLNIAEDNEHLNICKALVYKRDFDVHLKDNDGWTALHRSALSGTYELLFLFSDMRADIYLKFNDGWSCLNVPAVN